MAKILENEFPLASSLDGLGPLNGKKRSSKTFGAPVADKEGDTKIDADFETREQAQPNMESALVADALREALAESSLTIVVFGASGHLAKTKTYPALFELFTYKVFPVDSLQIIGYARSPLKLSDFRARISLKLANYGSPDQVEDFLSKCTYFSGKGYDDGPSHEKFAEVIRKGEERIIEEATLDDDWKRGNRLFYLATPPGVFTGISRCIKAHLGANTNGWNRVIVEKPFGRDGISCDKLLTQMAVNLREEQVYRIDHYLAKEMVQNILVLRFGNTIWDTIWDRRSIRCVKISMKESDGVEGRGGYYDEYGAIRDVFQNHLLQVLTLIAMEAPVSLSDDDIRDEKVKVLKAIQPPPLERVCVGQYVGYTDDPSVPNDSLQATFAQMVLFVKNKRWHGVPFVCKVGKALDERNTIVRIQFKNDGIGCLYPSAGFNELVIRLQPSEAIWLKLNTKKPGFARFDSAYSNILDLTYQSRFTNLKLPGAYSRLILDALSGDQSLFVRDDELREAWRVVDPILNARIKPTPYTRGGRGPSRADEMAHEYGFSRPLKYSWSFTKGPKKQLLKRQVSSFHVSPKNISGFMSRAEESPGPVIKGGKL